MLVLKRLYQPSASREEMTTIHTPNLTLQSCTIPHLQALIEGASAFESKFGVKVVEGYLEFPEALPYSLKQLQSGAPETWMSYLFIHTADHALIGMGGYKGAPDTEGMVEIGYGIAPAYRGRGYAREAAQGMIDYAFRQPAVEKVWAHALAEPNASVAVLKRCGLTMIEELEDPDEGKIWRWQLTKDQWLQRR
jgi:[ribosomal protein S5]-alanine N-acetyltransferase